MSRLLVLDAGPVGLLTRSPRVPEAQQCADYEVRRSFCDCAPTPRYAG